MDKPKSYKPKKISGSKKFGNKSSHQKGYDRDWFAYRARFLKHNPKCYACGLDSEIVDHLQAHKGDMVLFKKLNNHIPLCKQCHNTITGLFDKHANPDIKKKLEWLKAKRSYSGTMISVKVLPYYSKKFRI